MDRTYDLELRIFFDAAVNALGDFIVHEHPGQPADFQQVAAVFHLFVQVIELHLAHLGEVHGDAVGAGLGDDAVEGNHDDAGIAGLLDHAVQGVGRGGVDDDGVIALEDQVLDLGGLFGHLVFRGGERIGGGNDTGFNGRLGHLVPAFQHRLAPGVSGVIVGQGDFLVLGVSEGRTACQDGGGGDGANQQFLQHTTLP